MEDLTGRKFNYLSVLGFSYKKDGNYYWSCRCVCGHVIDVSRRSLIRGRKSCGCMNNTAHVGSNYHGGVPTHGMSRSRFYKIYHKMMERCYGTVVNSYLFMVLKCAPDGYSHLAISRKICINLIIVMYLFMVLLIQL